MNASSKRPVPMRESPYYEDTAFDGEAGDQITVTREIYKVGTQSSRLRLRARPTTGSAILGAYPKGTEVVKLANAGSANGHDWVQVTVRKGGATGYMAATYLTFVRSYTETVKRAQPGDRQGVSVQPSREQLFRIYAIDPDTTKGIIHIKARHIFYDLAHNIVNGDYSPDDVPIETAAQHAFGVLLNDHKFPAARLCNRKRDGRIRVEILCRGAFGGRGRNAGTGGCDTGGGQLRYLYSAGG